MSIGRDYQRHCDMTIKHRPCCNVFYDFVRKKASSVYTKEIFHGIGHV